MLDEKSIWQGGYFLTRSAEEHGVLQVDEASLYAARHRVVRATDGELQERSSKPA
jgi:hypothetical protein